MKEKESVGAFYLSIFPIDSKKNCFKYPLTVALLTMTRSPFQGELRLARSIEVNVLPAHQCDCPRHLET